LEETATLKRATAALDARGRATHVPERCVDISLTVLALALLVAIAIHIDSPDPVRYRSRRAGRGGEMFEMLKFRKMHRDAGICPGLGGLLFVAVFRRLS